MWFENQQGTVNSSTKLSSSHAKGSKETEWTSFVQKPALWTDLWPSDLKINREHLLFMYTLKQMRQKILSRQSLVYRPTKRLSGAKQNTLFFKGRGHKQQQTFDNWVHSAVSNKKLWVICVKQEKSNAFINSVIAVIWCLIFLFYPLYWFCRSKWMWI